MAKRMAAFERWWQRGNNHIPHLQNYQRSALKDIARRAFNAGVAARNLKRRKG